MVLVLRKKHETQTIKLFASPMELKVHLYTICQHCYPKRIPQYIWVKEASLTVIISLLLVEYRHFYKKYSLF